MEKVTEGLAVNRGVSDARKRIPAGSIITVSLTYLTHQRREHRRPFVFTSVPTSSSAEK